MAAMLTETALFLSTPSARRATIIAGCCPLLWIAISIHALREEGDVVYERFRSLSIVYFYPRPPRGGRPSPSALHSTSQVFLSTPSARRATLRLIILYAFLRISIHALREEGDGTAYLGADLTGVFLSTPSARRATEYGNNTAELADISIHALREEGDEISLTGNAPLTIFLSTPSARRATSYFSVCLRLFRYFYPRPPRGGRPPAVFTRIASLYFYPRPPRGGRHEIDPNGYGFRGISIHALREEGDVPEPGHHTNHRISIHALREEGDQFSFA